MTAYRIVTDHNELDNVGQVSHQQLDYLILNTGYVVPSGSLSAPLLGAGRMLVQGAGITIQDTGPGGQLIVSSNAATTGSRVSWMESPAGSRIGGNVDFVLAHDPFPSGSLMFFYNGQLLEQGPFSDYTLSGSTVHMLFTPMSSSKFWATYPF